MGAEVLDKLISAGYVIKYDCINKAMKAHGGKILVSKLALITTEKDGQLKHRLILDCRVSGANSSTTKWEKGPSSRGRRRYQRYNGLEITRSPGISGYLLRL